MSFVPPSRLNQEVNKVRAEERAAEARRHEEVHRALGRVNRPKGPQRLWQRFLRLLTGNHRNWD